MQGSETMLAQHLLDQLAERIETETGLSFPAAKQRDLKTGVDAMTRAKGFDDTEACIDWLLSGRWDKQKTDLCALHLTIGETYFFREPRAFDLVCDYARKKLKDPDFDNRQLRIWSAGCCTGEEPYSIAMALRHGVPELEPRRISILGTDISSRNLQVARIGTYRQWSFRDSDSAYTALKRLDFSEDGEGQFRINDQIRTPVRFSELNLAAFLYPSVTTDTQAMDVIFCRNVLMYFSKDQAMKVIERFRECLVSGGWLIVSPSEASVELFPGFSAVYYPDAVYFQKNNHNDARPVQNNAAPPDEADNARQKDARAYPVSGRVVRAPAIRARAKQASVKSMRREARQHAASAQADAGTILHARALAADGDIAEAMRYLENAINTGPPSAELYQAKALIEIESGDHREAIHSLKRVLYLKPGFILAHYLMGVLQSAQDRPREAAREFKTAADLLAALDGDEIVPGSDGLAAAYLLESARAYLQKRDS